VAKPSIPPVHGLYGLALAAATASAMARAACRRKKSAGIENSMPALEDQ